MNATEPMRPEEAELTEETEVIIRQRLATLEQDRKRLSPAQDVFRRILQPAP